MVWCFRHLLCSLDRIYRYIFGACLWPGLPDWIYPYNFAIPNALNMLGSDSCYLYTMDPTKSHRETVLCSPPCIISVRRISI